VADPKADAAVRAAALQALLARRNPDLVPLLQGLLDEPALRGTAVRGLAAFADPRTPKLLLDRYASFTDSEKADAIHTLASRPAGALALLEAVRTKKVPRADLTAFTIRQMQGLNDQRVNDGIAATWGVPRPASQEKTALMTKYRALLRPEALANADRSRGRALYARTCASCHVLFGEGGKVGPELTGSQRMNIDYLLENILDPSALVPREYQVTVLSLEDGRVVTGIILEETERVVAVQTANEVLRLPRAEIEERRSSPASMMPEGQLAR
jgi:putative heme-binding domain-containing protein